MRILLVVATLLLGGVLFLVLSVLAGMAFIFISDAIGNSFLLTNTVFYISSMMMFILLSAWLAWTLLGRRIWERGAIVRRQIF